MRQTKTFSLLRASQINSLHPTEIQLPGLVSAKNVYISPSDNAITLRHDFYTFRDDIQTSVDHWQTASTDDKSDFLNIIITGSQAADQIYITRLFPHNYDGTIASSVYTAGTITTTGASSSVVGSGTYWIQSVWAGCFIEFAGSSNLYRITEVGADTRLTVSGTPPALTGASYTIYRTHDSTRGLWPMKFDRVAYNYLYNAVNNVTLTTADQNSNSGPFYQARTSQRSNEPYIVDFTKINDPDSVLENTGTVVIDLYWDGSKWILLTGTNQVIDRVLTSTDLAAWTTTARVQIPYNSNGGQQLPPRLRKYGTTYYIAGPAPGVSGTQSIFIVTSTDLVSWTIKSVDTVDYSSYGEPAQREQNDSAINADVGSGNWYGPKYLWQNDVPAGVYRAAIGGDSNFYTSIWQNKNTASSAFAGPPMAMRCAVANGGGKTVVASNDKIYYSADESTWTAVNLNLVSNYTLSKDYKISVPSLGPAGGPPSIVTKTVTFNVKYFASWINDVIHTGTNFVAVGANGYVYYSSNGIAWSRAASGTTAHLYTLISNGSGVVIAVGGNNTIIKSADHGATWTKINSDTTKSNLIDISYSSTGTKWHAVGWELYSYSVPGQVIDGVQTYQTITVSANYGKYSSDGATFAAFTLPTGLSSSYNKVMFCEHSGTGLVVGSQVKNLDYTTDDGANYNVQKDDAPIPDWKNLTLGNEFVAVGTGGTIAYSADGRSWTSLDTNVTVTLNDVAHSVDTYIAVGETGTILTSQESPPTEWTSRTSGVSIGLNGIAIKGPMAAGSGLAVAVGDATGGAGVIRTSADLVTWTSRTSGTANDLFSVAYNGSNLWCIVGESGTILTSTNGTSWTSRTSGTSEDLNDVTYSNSLWVAVGNAGTILTSTDGTTWVARTSGVTGNLYTVTRVTRKFQAWGAAGTGVDSSDGITWASLSGGLSVDIRGVANGGDWSLIIGTGGNASIVYNRTTQNFFKPVSDQYRACSFAVSGGYLVLIGTSEFEGGNFKYFPRRIRWATPGTIDDFTSTGAGATDLPGTGQLISGESIGNSIILFESASVAVLNPTDDIESPFTYQVIHATLRKISNAISIDQWCYFVATNGKLYKTNGFAFTEVCQPFDLSKYRDFDDGGPIWLVYDREIRRILCYRPRKTDTTHECFIIDPDNSTVTAQILPDVTVAGGGYYQGASGINFARSLPQMATEEPFWSTLDVTDTDNDGDPDFPNKTPIPIKWLIYDATAVAGEVFRSGTYSSSDAQFVTCGEGGAVYTLANATVTADTDEIILIGQCTSRTSGTAETLWAIGYDATKYIAVGANGTAIYSSDGINWSAGTAAVINATDTILGICDSIYAPRVVAWAADGVASKDYILYSDDNGATFSLAPQGAIFDTIYEINWLTNVDTGTLGCTVVDYSDATMSGATITVKVNSVTTTLTEGVDWTAGTDNDTTATSIASAIGAVSGLDATSAAAVVTVTPVSSATVSIHITTNAAATGLTVSNTCLYLMTGGQYATYYSYDGITWVAINDLVSTASQASFYMDGKYRMAGNDGIWQEATNLQYWRSSTLDTEADAGCGANVNNQWMFIGTYQEPANYIVFSDNGERWFYYRKPTAPYNGVLEVWELVWTGSYLMAICADRAS